MTPSLTKTFNALEQQRANLTETVNAVSDEVYLRSPSAKWSIAQVIAHIITSERLSLMYMRKKSLGIDTLKDSGIRQSIVFMLLKISQRVPLRYRAPKAVVDNTPESLSKEEAFARWEKARQELRDFLDTIPEKHAHRLIFKHPVGGMLDVQQAVGFMYEHVRHHWPQIKRLLNP